MLIRRLVKGVAYSCAGSLFGATSGLLLGMMARPSKESSEHQAQAESQKVPRTEEEHRAHRRKKLLGRVHRFRSMRTTWESVQKLLESAFTQLSEDEYQARRELELMGYYPCSKCGIPHLEGGEIDCLPIGAYFSEALGRYVEPEHPDWKKDEYEEATGEKWDETASQKDGSVH